MLRINKNVHWSQWLRCTHGEYGMIFDTFREQTVVFRDEFCRAGMIRKFDKRACFMKTKAMVSVFVVAVLLTASLAILQSDNGEERGGETVFGIPGDGVVDVFNVPEMVVTRVPWALTGTVTPIEAAHLPIAWGLRDTGSANATLSGNILTARIGGTTTVAAFVQTEREFITVSAGNNHTMAIDDDGGLWAWGSNSNGQLGDGTTDERLFPVQIEPDVRWVHVSVGNAYTMAIDDDGNLWAWGSNSYGQLGDGTAEERLSPVQIEEGTVWTFVSAGAAHTMAINEDDELWAWGSNSNGQLGDGSTTDRHTPVQIEEETVWISVSAGAAHTMAINEDGELWAWGSNSNGQLGDGSTIDRHTPVQTEGDDWIYVSAGNRHTAAVNDDNELWVWGSNSHGQLGDGTNDSITTPVQVGIGVNWTSVSASDTHTAAFDNNGELRAWGSNDSGQLGNGTDMDKTTPFPSGTTILVKDFIITALERTYEYEITGFGTSFSAIVYLENGMTHPVCDASGVSIQDVIDAKRTDAFGNDITITFMGADLGNGDFDVLDIGDTNIFIDNADGSWGNIILQGKVTSAFNKENSAVIHIFGDMNVDSYMDIISTGDEENLSAIINDGNGELNIFGGTIETSAGGQAIMNSFGGSVFIHDGIIRLADAMFGNAISNTGFGDIHILGGEIISDFRAIRNSGPGTIYVTEGIVTSSDINAIVNVSNGTIIVTGGIVQNTESRGWSTISNFADGTVIVRDGIVQFTGGNAGSMNSFAIENHHGIVEITGGIVRTTAGGGTIVNYAGGTVNISGGTVENASLSTGEHTIRNVGNGTINISGGTVTGAGLGDTIQNIGSGTVNISGGTVANTLADRQGSAIFNVNDGIINITDGTVWGTGVGTLYGVINNMSVGAQTGTVNISGGSVEARGPISAVNNFGNGTINIIDGTVVNTHTFAAAIQNERNGAVNIFGGEVRNTNNSSTVVNGIIGVPGSTGTINISGGTVVNGGAGGSAVTNIFNGIITISGGEVRNTNNSSTVANGLSAVTGTAGTVNISGGTTENGGTGAVVNNVFGGTISVSDGTVAAAGTTSIHNRANGNVVISGGTVENRNAGGITIWNAGVGTISVNGGTVISLGNHNAILNQADGTVNVGGGTVASHTAGSVIANGATAGDPTVGIINVSGGTVENRSAGAAINNVRNGTVNVSGGLVTSAATVTSVSNSANGTINIFGGTVQNTNTNTLSGHAVMNGTGTVRISGGIVSTESVNAVTTNTGSVILGDDPTINGAISILPGSLSVLTADTILGERTIPAFATDKEYGVNVRSPFDGAVAVFDGTNLLSNFNLVNTPGFALFDNGMHLILGTAIDVTIVVDPETSDGIVSWSYNFNVERSGTGATLFSVIAGTVISLSSADGVNYMFLYWTKDNATTGILGNDLIHPVTAPIIITAVFIDNESGTDAYEVTIEKEPAVSDAVVEWTYVHNGVTVSGGEGTFNMPAGTLELVATDGNELEFVYWSVNTEPPAGMPYRETDYIIEGNVTITGVFGLGQGTELWEVIVRTDPTDTDGVVSWNYTHNGVTVIGSTGTFNIPAGTKLELTAVDGTTSGFMYWALSTAPAVGISGNEYEHTVTGNITITAFFGDSTDDDNDFRTIKVEKVPITTDGTVSWIYVHDDVTVTGGTGTFNMPLNANVTLTATEHSIIYVFRYWNVDDSPTAGRITEHTVTESITITAVFEEYVRNFNYYMVTILTDPANADGAVAWTYVYDDEIRTGIVNRVTGPIILDLPAVTTVSLKATDGTNFGFLYWTVSTSPGIGISGDELDYTVSRSVTITAFFGDNTLGEGTEYRTVTVEKDPEDADGVVSWTYTHNGLRITGGTGTFNIPVDTELELTATDGTDFGFMYWTLSTELTAGISDNVIEHKVIGNVTITAFFGDNTDGHGTEFFVVIVETDPKDAHENVSWTYVHEGVTVSGGAGTFNVPANVVMILTASEGNGWLFFVWYGDISSDGMIYALTVDDDKRVVALFYHEDDAILILTATALGPGTGMISWSIDGNGWIELAHNLTTVPEGMTGVVHIPESLNSLWLRASADDGMWFFTWSGHLAGSTGSQELIMDGSRTVFATFYPNGTETFTLTSTSDGGKIRWSLDGVTYADLPREQEIPADLTVHLIVIPDHRRSFTEWTEDLSGNENPTTLTMESDKMITANFEHHHCKWLWHALLILITALTFKILWLAIWGRSACGIVRCEGKRVEGATVTYTLNGDDKTVVTNSSGKYKIEAPSGSKIAIVSVSKDDLTTDALPKPFVAEKKTRNDFNIE